MLSLSLSLEIHMWLYHTKHYHQNNIYVNVIFIIIIRTTYVAYHTKYIHEKVLTKIHCTFILSCYVMYHPVMYFVYHIILFNGTLYHLPMCTLIMFLWHPHHVPMAASSYSYGPLIIFLNSNSPSSCSYGTHHVHCARTFILKPSFY